MLRQARQTEMLCLHSSLGLEPELLSFSLTCSSRMGFGSAGSMTPDMYMDDSSSTASPRTSEAGGPLKVGPGQPQAAEGSDRAAWQSTLKQETSAMPLAVDNTLAAPACLACLPCLRTAGFTQALGQAACLLRAVHPAVYVRGPPRTRTCSRMPPAGCCATASCTRAPCKGRGPGSTANTGDADACRPAA